MMDFVLEAWVSSNIERAKTRWMLGGGQACSELGDGQTSLVLRPGIFTSQNGTVRYFIDVKSYWLPDEQPGLQQPQRVFSSTRSAGIARTSATFLH